MANELENFLGQGVDESLVKDVEDIRQVTYKRNVLGSVDTNPDEFAEATNLGAKHQLPPDIVQNSMPEVKRKERFNNIDKAVAQSDALREWLTVDPANAKIAHDDVENLGFFEGIWKELKESKFRTKDVLLKAPAEELIKTPGTMLKGLGDINDAVAMSIISGLRGIGLESVAEFFEEPVDLPWWVNPSEIVRQPGKQLVKAGEKVGVPEERRTIYTEITGVTGQVGAQALIYALNPAAGVTGLYAQGASIGADEAKLAGATGSQQATATLAYGAITSLTEKYGLDMLLDRVPPAIKNRVLRSLADKVIAGGIEASQEVVEGYFHNVVASLTFDPERRLTQGLDREALVAGGGAALIRTLLGGGRGVQELYHNHQRARQAKLNENIIQALGENAAASKVRERLPDKYKDFVRRVKAKGDVDNIYIPADKFAEYFQSQDIDPVEMARNINPALADNINEAIALGEDVEIPLEDFQTYIAPTEHLAGLSKDMRFHYDDMTAREAEEFEQQNLEELEAFFQSVSDESEASQQRLNLHDTIKQQMKEQFLRAGQSEKVSEQLSTLYAARSLTRAERLGVEPEALLRERDVIVRSEVLERLREKPVDELDLMIDRLKAGRVPTDREIGGQTLLDFLRSKGGVQDFGGELAARDIPTRRGQRRLIQERGLSLDAAAQAAQEAGFFPGEERPTINDLLDAIDREVRGEPVTAGIDEAAAIEQRDLQELERIIGEAGLDLETATNEEIKTALGEFEEPRPVVSRRGVEFEQRELDDQRKKDLRETQKDDILNIRRDLQRLKEGKYVPERIPARAQEGILSSGVGEALDFLRRFHEERDEIIIDREVRNTPTTAEQERRENLKAAESIALKEWAQENDFWRDSTAFYSQWEQQGKLGGSEHLVVLSPGGKTVRKVATARMNVTLHDYLSRLAIHNYYFPETSYRFIGMSENKEGNPIIMVEQNSVDMSDASLIKPNFDVEGQSPRDLRAKAHEEMRKLGFEEKTFSDYEGKIEGEALTFHYFVNEDGIVIYDLHHENVIHRPDGSMDFVDPVITFDPSTQLDRLQKSLEDIELESLVRGFGGELFQQERVAPEGRVSRDAEGNVFFQSAFHGTPHKFDKFTLEHIGTGEGAQAYGWGLYFAASKDVANFYAETAIDPNKINVKKLPNQFYESFDVPAADIRSSAANLMRDEAVNPGTLEKLADNETYQGMLAQAIIEGNIEREKGQLLRVELAPKADEWLDWDKRLSEQSDKVKKALSKLDESFDPNRIVYEPEMAGNRIYERIKINEGSAREASLALKEAGIPGIKYLDAVSRGKERGTSNYVVFDESLIEIQEFLQAEPTEPTVKRGSIFLAENQAIITLMKDANLSTALHEFGHLFVTDLARDAQLPGAPQQIKDDFKTLMDFVGAKSINELDPNIHGDDAVEKQEQLARAFEAYLREGKAPSVELQSAFQTFKAWLKRVYQSLLNLNVEINDDIRNVFDRMLATDQEIKDAEAFHRFEPVFKSAEQGGLTPEEFNAINKAAEKATKAAEDDLLKETMKELAREETQAWKDAKARVQRQVEDEINQMPVYQAHHYLTTGEILVGELPEGHIPARMSKQALVDTYGKEILKRIPRGKQAAYTEDGGVDPDIIAEQFGFSSGDEMIKAFLRMQKREDIIKNETAIRMKEEFGDIMTDGRIEEEAINSIHSDQRASFMHVQLKALSKRAGLEVTPKQVIKQAAKRIVAGRKIKDINLGRVSQAEVRASNELLRAATSGDFQAAVNAQYTQLLQHYIYMESKKVKDEITRGVKKVKQYNKASTRAKIGKAGGEYLEKIDAIINNFEFRKSLRQLDKLRGVKAWAEKQREEGNFVDLPDGYLEGADKKHYRELTIEEFRAVQDAIENIKTVALNKNRLLTDREKRLLEDAVTEITESINANWKGKRRPPKLDKTEFEKKKDVFVKAYSLRKFEAWARELDGYKPDGPFQRLIYRTISRATDEYELKTAEFATAFREIFEDFSTKEFRTASNKRQYYPEVDESLTRTSLWMIALNYGNKEGRERLMTGFEWSQEQIESLLDNMEEKEWQVVDRIWKYLDSKWPETRDLEKRTKGVVPERVEAIPIQTRFGAFEGGYFPIKYSRALSDKAVAHEAEELYKSLKGGMMGRPGTRKGRTIERLESVGQGYKLRLDLDVLLDHVRESNHDVAYREALHDVTKLINHPRMTQTIRDTAGDVRLDMIRDWLQDAVVGDVVKPIKFADMFFGHIRRRTTFMTMGWKLSTALVQPLGYTQTVARFIQDAGSIKEGMHYAVKGIGKFYGSPAKMKEQYDFVMENSKMMRSRLRNYDREVHDSLKRLKKGRVLDEYERSLLLHIAKMQMLVDMPTWLGAYEFALDNFAAQDTKKAAEHADSVVRLTQGSGLDLDLAPIQRGGETQRILNMYMTFFNSTHNMLVDEFKLTQRVGPQRMGQLVFNIFLMTFVPSVLLESLYAAAGAGGPDDDESWTEWALEQWGLFMMAPYPVIRDIGSNVIGDFPYQISPVQGSMKEVSKLANEIKQGEADRALARSLIKTVGVTPGLPPIPANQILLTSEYFYDYLQGTTGDFSLVEAFVKKNYNDNK